MRIVRRIDADMSDAKPRPGAVVLVIARFDLHADVGGRLLPFPTDAFPIGAPIQAAVGESSGRSPSPPAAILWRFAPVAIRLFPLDSFWQTSATFAGATIAIILAVYIGLKRKVVDANCDGVPEAVGGSPGLTADF